MAASSIFVCVSFIAVFVFLVTPILTLEASSSSKEDTPIASGEELSSGNPSDSSSKDAVPVESVAELDKEVSPAADSTQKSPEESTAEDDNTIVLQEWLSMLLPESIQHSFWAFISDLQKEIDLYIKAEETNTAESEVSDNPDLTAAATGAAAAANSSGLNGVETMAVDATNASSNSNITGELSAVEQDKNETVSKKPRFLCTGKNITENSTGVVQMVNGTTLLEKLTFENNASGSDCILVFFYAPWCHFSAQASASYNTLGRAFPQLDIIAVDAVQFSSLNARFGVVSVPNIMFFHHTRSVVRFNSSKKTFENMALFVKNMTGLEADSSVEVSEQDMLGPLSSEATTEPDCLLYLAWIFINICSLYALYSSSIGQHMINKIHTLWQEHQHIE
ncbi:thioredoxin domain-containing protein 15-like [Argonauta hians]